MSLHISLSFARARFDQDSFGGNVLSKNYTFSVCHQIHITAEARGILRRRLVRRRGTWLLSVIDWT